MKKLAMAIAAIMFANMTFAESYLYWMVSPDNDVSSSLDWDAGWAKMRIHAVNSADASGNTYLNLYSDSGTQEGVTWVTGNDGAGASTDCYKAELSGCVGSTWTYFLEVYNADNGWNGMGKEGLAYSSAGDYIEVAGAVYSGAQPFNFATMNTYVSVPEPNSAMLLLMGLSALALRRKRAAKKA